MTVRHETPLGQTPAFRPIGMTSEELFAASAIRLGRRPRTIGELRRFRLGLARLRTKRIVRGAGFGFLALTPGGEEQVLAALGAEPSDEVLP